MIFGGPREVRDSQCLWNRYFQKEKRPPQIVVHTTGSKRQRGYTPQPDNIVFTKANESEVYHPHEDTLVINAKVANSLVHWLLVDSESAVNILY